MNPIQSQRPEDPAASPLKGWLVRLRSIARIMLVLQRVGWVLAIALAILIAAGVADYVLRTPRALRVGLWVVGAMTLVGVFRRVIWPAIRFRPSLTEIALRVENSSAGRQAGLSGVLAAGLELGTRAPGASDGTSAKVAEEARRRLGSLSAATALAPTRTVRSMVWLAAAMSAVLLIAGLEPRLTRIAAVRLLWPVSLAQWPKRTSVIDITGVEVHPLGSALALRAAVNSRAGRAEDARVIAHYRVLDAESPGPWQQVLLTGQDRDVRLNEANMPIDVAMDDRPTTGHLFERLIEPSGLTSSRVQSGGTPLTLEYWFQTDDDQTGEMRVLLVEPPAVRSASATIQLPAYAASMLDRFPELTPTPGTTGGGTGTIELGPGSDDRAAAPPILSGSRVSLSIRFNKPLPGQPEGAPASIRTWVERSLGPEAATLLEANHAAAERAPVLETTGDTWRLSWTLDRPLRLNVKALDEHGIAGAEESNYRFDALTDNPPSAVITLPTEDKSVLATASVPLAGEARDDVGLSWVTLERQLARRPQGSEGAPAEPLDERVEFARVEPDHGAPEADARRIATSSTLELSELELQPGDEIWIALVAADGFDLAGASHPPVRSGVRKLRIMSREELVQQIWSELGGVRRTAVKIDQDQKEAAKGTSRKGIDETRRTERAQTGISERLARQTESIQALEDRIAENGLTDQTLADVLRQTTEHLNKAGQSSSQASQSLNKAEKAESAEQAPPDAGAEERQEAGESQEDVRKELSQLIDLLDQGEDTYAARRALEQILEQQKSLRDRTQETGQSTTGKSPQQLSAQEKQDLQQISQQQQENAQKLTEAIDKMLERERKLEKNDPAAAQQMAQSAQRGQREQAAEKMKQASQQVAQNQTNSAQQQQNQAIQSLEQMLKELDKTASTRDEVLRRFLATLMDSIRALIEQQEARIAELEAAIPDKAFRGLDAAMARLHQTTLGVLDEAQAAPREAADALSLLERAADAQAAAVVALRDEPVNDDEVMAQEQLSLEKLKEALETAEKLDDAAEERQNDRKRAELRGRYEELLQSQLSIRDSTAGLVGAEVTRRSRATARQLGQDQETLRQAVEAIRKETAEMAQARVFDYAHARMDELMKFAVAALGQGEATLDVTRRQTGVARLLQSLVESLDDRKKDDKKFREREQGNGGGGSGNQEPPLIPPAAELKLLRLMQIDAAERTRAVGENKAQDGATVAEVMQMQRELADQAKALLERVKNQGGGGAEPASPGAAPAPGDPPKDDGAAPAPPAEPETSPS